MNGSFARLCRLRRAVVACARGGLRAPAQVKLR